MIAICFPRELSIKADDGANISLLPFSPEARDDGYLVLDPQRVYLTLEEMVHGLANSAIHHALPQPVRLSSKILDSLPRRPRPLAELLANPVRQRVRVFIMNGGGGGLGDGILAAPALAVLSRRLQEATGVLSQLDVGSMTPQRTRAVLAGIPGVAVRPLPISLAEFMEYDAVADLSCMLEDPAFQHGHMTDFFLTRLGIDPDGVPTTEKAPFLHLPSEIPEHVATALAGVYAMAAGRPLVAVVFISAYTRSMPKPQAAAIIRRLAEEGCQPVLMFPEGHSADIFMARYDLHGVTADVSEASRTFLDYFMLLAAMDGIVTVDTSAVHVGAALKKPTVAIFNSINMDYRIRYSPTVHGIQLVYRGRTCQTPCGLSKSRAYIQGQLPDGKPLRLECGYACDEAVDREAILQEAVMAIICIKPGEDAATQCENIRLQMADRLHAPPAPCWKMLDQEEVVRRIMAMLQSEPRSM